MTALADESARLKGAFHGMTLQKSRPGVYGLAWVKSTPPGDREVPWPWSRNGEWRGDGCSLILGMIRRRGLRSEGVPGNVAGKEPIALDANELENPPSMMSPWRLLPLAVVVAGFIGFFVFGLDEYLSFEGLGRHRQALLAWRAENAVLSAVAFIALYALIVTLSVPGAVWLSIGGGFVFGTVSATVGVLIGATVGATAIFLIARYALADYFRAKAGKAIRRMEAGFRENALSYLLVLRLIPVFPFWLVNLVPAFLGVPLHIFVIGTFLGIIPGAFVFSGIGDGLGAVFDSGGEPNLGILFEPPVLLPIIGLVVLSLLPIAYKRYKRHGT